MILNRVPDANESFIDDTHVDFLLLCRCHARQVAPHDLDHFDHAFVVGEPQLFLTHSSVVSDLDKESYMELTK